MINRKTINAIAFVSESSNLKPDKWTIVQTKTGFNLKYCYDHTRYGPNSEFECKQCQNIETAKGEIKNYKSIQTMIGDISKIDLQPSIRFRLRKSL